MLTAVQCKNLLTTTRKFVILMVYSLAYFVAKSKDLGLRPGGDKVCFVNKTNNY